jgi:Zn-dependent peptidase ImmA (M78 family)
MRRGFKAFAEEIAREVRNEMGVPAHGRVCAFQLADYLGVPTLRLSDLAGQVALTAEQRLALRQEVHGFCMPLPDGRRAIVYNDFNGPPRQQSDVAHEAAHLLLQHQFRSLKQANWREQEEENEAAFLGGALLVPLAAALNIVRRNMGVTEAANSFGVSEQMIAYRCNVSGARAILNRKRAR